MIQIIIFNFYQIFNGIGSQDLRWATERQMVPRFDPQPQVHFDQSKYPKASDFLK